MSTFGTPESVYEDNARKAAFDKKHKATKTKALEKNYAPAELKTIGQNYKKLFDEQRYVDNRSSRRKHAREYDKEHGTKDNR